MSEFLNNIKNQFEKFCGENPSNDIVNDFRIKSFENFNNLGLPTTKDEDWRFTNLNEFYKKIKNTFTPGLENSDFVSDLDVNNFIKEARTFYESKGTEESFRILLILA